jgi:hypothetical protein
MNAWDASATSSGMSVSVMYMYVCTYLSMFIFNGDFIGLWSEFMFNSILIYVLFVSLKLIK